MKKSNLLFVLSAFVLLGGIAGCSTNEPSTSTSTSTSTVATKHAVVIPTSVAGAYVTASHSEAVAGDSVKLTVALTDPTNYELKSVKVGEQLLKGTADANNANVFHYSFVMGDADANVSVVTEKIVAPVVEKHAVVVPTSVAGAYVTASRSEAAEGDEVDITVALTDPTNYELKSVKVGDKVLEGKVDANNKYVFHYSVVMGKADVNVSVVTEQIVAPTKDHTISFEGKDLAFALEMPQDANVGEHVSFKVAARSGYEITSVKVVKVSAASAAEEGAEPVEEEVTLTGNAVLGYSFDMPDADVVIKAEALGAYFKVNADSEKTIFQAKGSTSSDSKLSVSSFIYSFIDSGNLESTLKPNFFRAGSEVTVVAKHNAFAIANKFFANGVELEKVASDTAVMYKFTMPATSVELSVEAVDKTVNVDITAAEHTTTSLYRIKSDKSHEETTFGYPGETLYLDLTINDADKDDYNLTSSAISATMLKYSNEKGLTTNSTDITVNKQSGSSELKATYSFTVSSYYVAAGPIKITTAEKYMKKYLGKPFIGQWQGFEIYRKAFQTTPTTMEFKADGSVGGNAYNVSGSIKSVDEEKGVITLENKKVINYEGNAAWCYWSSAINDIYVFSKDIVDNEKLTKYVRVDGNNLIALIYETVSVTENEQTVEKQVLRLGALVTSSTVVLNIDVEMISGSNIQESGSKFLVKKNAATILAVGLGDEYGTYKNGDSTLVLDGAGKATLDGVEGTYIVDSANKNKVTVTIAEVVHVYTIDKSAKTFTDYVEALKSLYSSFVSTKFNNKLVLNEDGTGTYNGSAINFTFVESTNKVTFSINGVSFDLTWDATAGTLIGTFNDGDNNDITFNIVVEEGPFYLGKFSFSLMNPSGYTTDAVLTITENSIDVTFTSFSGDGTKTSYSVTEGVTFQEKRIFGEGTKYIEVTINPTTKTVTKVEIFADGEADSAQYESKGSLTKQA